MRKFFLGVFIVALLLATFATLPRVDYIEPNVLFYLQHLTPLYYVCVFAAIAMAVYYRRDFLGLLSAIVLGLLIIWTPSIMLVQPWFLDTYPFVAEAVYVVRNGHIGDFHVLSINPPLGLTFGPFLMITGISPSMLQKIYPGLFATIFAVLLYITAKKMKIGKESLVLAPLLFISIAWPLELHFSRQSISLIYYLASWLLLLHLIQRSDRRIFALLVSQIFLLTMSHPATPLFFIANLATIAFLGRIWPKFRPKEFRVIVQTLLISALAWIAWNLLSPTGTIRTFASIAENLVSSLIESPSEVSGIARIFAKYTPLYGLTINIRFALTLAVFISAILLPFAMYRYLQDRKILVILTGWIISNMFSSVPLLYAGLPYFTKPVLFTFISWAPLGALVHNTLTTKRKSGMRVKIKSVEKWFFIVAFIVIPLLLTPLIKHGPLPILYSTSRELANKSFLDLYRSETELVVYLEFNLPYGYGYILYGHYEPKALPMWEVYHYGEGVDSRVDNALVWITERLLVRDAFFVYKPSMLQVVENFTQTLPENMHNKVYDAGWPEWILIPSSRSMN